MIAIFRCNIQIQYSNNKYSLPLLLPLTLMASANSVNYRYLVMCDVVSAACCYSDVLMLMLLPKCLEIIHREAKKTASFYFFAITL